jgi:hypothetical protein
MPSKPEQNRKDVAAARARAKAAKMTRVEIVVHRDDAQAVRDFAATLRSHRQHTDGTAAANP